MTPRARVAHVTTVDLTPRFLLMGQLRRLRDEGYEVSAISAPGPWTSDLEAEGIRHIPWHHATRSWDAMADARALWELIGILRRERFDLVHTHNPKPGILGRIAAKIARVPCVVNTVHGIYATPEDRAPKKLFVLGLEAAASRLSDFELYQSEEDLAWARKLRVVRPAKSALLGNGTDTRWFDPGSVPAGRMDELRRELGIPPGTPVVGMVGRLVAEKGFREFFAAARSVRSSRPEVRFLAIGDPNPEKADSIPEDVVARASSDVLFVGWRQDIRDLLAIMDVFVLPSWREGVPRSAIEAAAMGKAMVLTGIRGCREVARNGREALLIPPRNPDRLAAAITQLLENEPLRKEMGEAARRRAIERFDEEQVANRVVGHYARLLRRKGFKDPSERWVWPGAVRIRSATTSDARDMARLHRQCLPTAFLPALGEPFLRRLYRALVTGDDAVALVAEHEGALVGFAAGVASVRDFYRRFFIRHGIGAAIAAAPKLLRLEVLRRSWETARYTRHGSTSIGNGLPHAELLSIGVTPVLRARGVGGALAEGILKGLDEFGAHEVKVVFGTQNQAASRLYAGLGFRQVGQLSLHRGEWSNLWVKSSPSVSLSESRSV